MPETTSKHFEIFTKEVLRARKELLLTDWEYCLEHGGCESGGLAECHSNSRDHLALIKLAEEWEDTQPTRKNLIVTARHEDIHVLISTLGYLARIRSATEEEITRGEERLVRHLQRIIYGDDDMVEIRGMK